MQVYVCSMCGWEYDPEQGCLALGVKPGTPFEDLPEDFCCPVCAARKVHFMPKEASPSDTSPSSGS